MHPDASLLLQLPFLILPLALLATWALLVRRAGRRLGAPAAEVRRRTWQVSLGGALWLVVATALALSGALRQWDATPPPVLPFILAMIAGAFVFAFSKAGTWVAQATPVAVLVAIQGFRLPLELAMHRAAAEGLMPPQMTWSGLNLDILTGVSAVTLALLAWRRPLPRWIFAVWNATGAVLLVTVMAIAILSLPLPIRTFMNEPANVWVTYFPFVFLPAICVQAAIAGHLLVLRRLRFEALETPPPAVRPASAPVPG